MFEPFINIQQTPIEQVAQAQFNMSTIGFGQTLTGDFRVGSNIYIDGKRGEINIKSSTGATTMIDGFGLVSTNNFAQTSSAISGGVGQLISSTTYSGLTDGVTPAQITVSAVRNTVVIVNAAVTYTNTHTDANPWTGITYIAIFVDGVEVKTFQEGHFQTATEQDGHANILNTANITYTGTIGTGDHTIQIAGKVTKTTNNPAFLVDAFSLIAVKMGN